MAASSCEKETKLEAIEATLVGIGGEDLGKIDLEQIGKKLRKGRSDLKVDDLKTWISQVYKIKKRDQLLLIGDVVLSDPLAPLAEMIAASTEKVVTLVKQDGDEQRWMEMIGSGRGSVANRLAKEASPEILANARVMVCAVRRHITDTFSNGRAVGNPAAALEAFELAAEELRSDKEFVVQIVAPHGGSMWSVFLRRCKFFTQRNVATLLHNDREAVLSIVQEDGSAIQFASDAFKNDFEIGVAALLQRRHEKSLDAGVGRCVSQEAREAAERVRAEEARAKKVANDC